MSDGTGWAPAFSSIGLLASFGRGSPPAVRPSIYLDGVLHTPGLHPVWDGNTLYYSTPQGILWRQVLEPGVFPPPEKLGVENNGVIARDGRWAVRQGPDTVLDNGQRIPGFMPGVWLEGGDLLLIHADTGYPNYYHVAGERHGGPVFHTPVRDLVADGRWIVGARYIDGLWRVFAVDQRHLDMPIGIGVNETSQEFSPAIRHVRGSGPWILSADNHRLFLRPLGNVVVVYVVAEGPENAYLDPVFHYDEEREVFRCAWSDGSGNPGTSLVPKQWALDHMEAIDPPAPEIVVPSPPIKLDPDPPRNMAGFWKDFYPLDYVALGRRMDLFRQAGAQTCRFFLPWSWLNPEEGEWRVDSLIERQMEAIVHAGLTLDVQLCSVMSPAWFWAKHPDASPLADDGTRFFPSTNRVQGTPISYWHPQWKIVHEELINRAFDMLLDKWSSQISIVRVSGGRLNEPTYPDDKHFWCYDDYAEADYADKFSADVPSPEEFPGMDPGERDDFIFWYRDRKDDAVRDLTTWVLRRLQPHQRVVHYLAGNGTVGGDLGRFIAGAQTTGLLRQMATNDWLMDYMGRQNPERVGLVYAGVGHRAGEPHSPAHKFMAHYRKRGYTYPIWGQIPTLKDNDPARIGDIIVELGMRGLAWTKDSDVFTNAIAPSPRFESLCRGYKTIAEAATPPPVQPPGDPMPTTLTLKQFHDRYPPVHSYLERARGGVQLVVDEHAQVRWAVYGLLTEWKNIRKAKQAIYDRAWAENWPGKNSITRPTDPEPEEPEELEPIWTQENPAKADFLNAGAPPNQFATTLNYYILTASQQDELIAKALDRGYNTLMAYVRSRDLLSGPHGMKHYDLFADPERIVAGAKRLITAGLHPGLVFFSDDDKHWHQNTSTGQILGMFRALVPAVDEVISWYMLGIEINESRGAESQLELVHELKRLTDKPIALHWTGGRHSATPQKGYAPWHAKMDPEPNAPDWLDMAGADICAFQHSGGVIDEGDDAFMERIDEIAKRVTGYGGPGSVSKPMIFAAAEWCKDPGTCSENEGRRRGTLALTHPLVRGVLNGCRT